MVEKKLLWYKDSDPVSETHTYNILIINNRGKIGGIKQKIRERLENVFDEDIMGQGLILDSGGLYYDLFCMSSRTSVNNFDEVYRVNKRKNREDRSLVPRVTRDGWDEFIAKIEGGEV